MKTFLERSVVLFQIRNRPPKIKMASLPDMPCPSMVSIGSTKPTIQDKTKSSPIRMNMAMNKPIFLASSRFSNGSLSTNIEMNMMLSMPRTNSSAVSVANAIHASGEVMISILNEFLDLSLNE